MYESMASISDQEMLDHIDDMAECLNDWECDFVDNIKLRVANNEVLTAGQTEKLVEIYEKLL